MKSYRLPISLSIVGFALIAYSIFVRPSMRSSFGERASLGPIGSISIPFGREPSSKTPKSDDDDVKFLSLDAKPAASASDLGLPAAARNAIADLQDWASDSEDAEERELDRLIETYSEYDVQHVFDRATGESRDAALWGERVKKGGQEILIRRDGEHVTAFSKSASITFYFQTNPVFDLASTFKEKYADVLVTFKDGSKLFNSRDERGSYWSFKFPDGRKTYRFLNPDGTPQFSQR
ncbi:MAG: hypothetical protein AAB250_10550 [Bdellovibrionota bacterium]